MSKRSFLSLVMALCMLQGFVFAGGGNEKANGKAVEKNAITKLTMMYWHPEQKEIMEKMNSLFTEANPGVVIELEQVPGDQYDTILKTRLLANNGPDLFLYFGGTAYLYGKDGHFGDLTNEPFSKTILPAFRGTVSYEGKLYAVPLSALTSGVWYNKALFAKAGINNPKPKNWNEFIEICEKLKKAGIIPISRGARDAWTGLIENSSMISSLVLGKNENFQVDRANGKFKFVNDAGFNDFLNKYILLVDKEYIGPGALGMNHSQAIQQVVDGKSAMNMFLSLGYGEMKQLDQKIDIGYFSIPDERGSIQFMGASDKALGYWAKGKNTELAKKVIAFYAKPEINKLYCESTATLPCIDGVKVDFDAPILDIVAELSKAKNLFTWFDAPWPQPAEDEFRRIIQEIHTGERDVKGMLTRLDKVYDDNLTTIRSKTAK